MYFTYWESKLQVGHRLGLHSLVIHLTEARWTAWTNESHTTWPWAGMKGEGVKIQTSTYTILTKKHINISKFTVESQGHFFRMCLSWKEYLTPACNFSSFSFFDSWFPFFINLSFTNQDSKILHKIIKTLQVLLFVKLQLHAQKSSSTPTSNQRFAKTGRPWVYFTKQ